MTYQFSTGLRTNMASQINATRIETTNGAWAQSTAYSVGNTVIAGGNTYKCTAAGTSAGSGSGPTGTGTSITDGGVTWTYSPPTLKIFSGAEPANCAASDPSGPLVTIQLPMTSMTSASGVASLAGTWSGSASAAGVAASYRIYDPAGVCIEQGNVSTDLVLNNTNIAVSQTVAVSSYSVTMGGA